MRRIALTALLVLTALGAAALAPRLSGAVVTTAAPGPDAVEHPMATHGPRPASVIPEATQPLPALAPQLAPAPPEPELPAEFWDHCPPCGMG